MQIKIVEKLESPAQYFKWNTAIFHLLSFQLFFIDSAARAFIFFQLRLPVGN